MSLKQHPLFIQGKQQVRDRDYDGAFDSFTTILKECEDKGIQMTADCAYVWFAYGDALLSKEEENPTDDLLGAAASEAKKAAAELAAELSAGDENGDTNDEGDDSDNEDVVPADIIVDSSEFESNDNSSNNSNINVADSDGNTLSDANEKSEETEEESVSDMEIAWDCLEVCRKICESEGSELNALLVETHIRLGDMQLFNGFFPQAIEEYKSALSLQCQISEDENCDRSVSSIHFMLATAHIYNSSEQKNEGKDANAVTSSSSATSQVASEIPAVDIIAEKKAALSNYKSSNRILGNALVVAKKKEAPEGYVCVPASTSDEKSKLMTEVEVMEDTIDELKETIDALEIEIQSLEKDFKPMPAAVTTIGFGNPASSNAANIFSFGSNSMSTVAKGGFNWGLGNTSSGFEQSHSESSEAKNVPVMQVKKKAKLNP